MHNSFASGVYTCRRPKAMTIHSLADYIGDKLSAHTRLIRGSYLCTKCLEYNGDDAPVELRHAKHKPHCSMLKLIAMENKG